MNYVLLHTWKEHNDKTPKEITQEKQKLQWDSCVRDHGKFEWRQATKNEWQEIHTVYGMAYGPSLLPPPLVEMNLIYTSQQDEDLIPFPMCWFPSKLMPMWVLNTRAAFRVFFVLENETAKAESTVSLFREDGLISWRDIKPEWLLTYNYSALSKLEKPCNLALLSFHSMFTWYFKNTSHVHISVAISVYLLVLGTNEHF